MNVDQFIAAFNQGMADIQSFTNEQLIAFRQTLLNEIDGKKIQLLAVDTEIACRAEA